VFWHICARERGWAPYKEKQMDEPSFRQACLADAAALAELANHAGEGMPLHLWETMREPGETAWDVGRRRAEREEGSFSYRNAVVAETGGRITAALIGYAQPAEPEPIDYQNMSPVFIPLQELENLAPNTSYVNVLAVHPDHRRRGIGARLMAIAEETAVREGKPGLSVIVSDANIGAKLLYLGCGYRQTATRPMVKGAWSTEGENWILLTKPL
jgi:ribosomal protein S18 acetylase RimI-like enzyme